MSLPGKILSLLSGITDPTLRMDVATTINYLFQVYMTGSVEESRIRREIYDVCYDVIRMTRPELTDAEVKEETRRLEDEFIRIFRLETSMRRVMTRFRRVGEYMA